MNPFSILQINQLPGDEKRNFYLNIIPPELLKIYSLSRDLFDDQGNDLLNLTAEPESSSVEICLKHQEDFPDPILYGHVMDTVNGRLHILIYVMNNVFTERFDIDRLADGTSTDFGTSSRNIEAEQKAIQAGLNPGQIFKGLGLLNEVRENFERFVAKMGHDLYFVEPLYYHNAMIFERYGFTYQRGKSLMERIHHGFSQDGDLIDKLDGSTFRKHNAISSIRYRSWAIHDGILGEPFTGVTMYKRIGETENVNTSPGIDW
ncbi:MAG: hypothetical protein JXA19_00690 [Anaerolineales bacterium]|nr:hypothetical protein [Anaerolineales bacterium]